MTLRAPGTPKPTRSYRACRRRAGRPSTGWWYWLKSSSNYTTAGQVQWGSGSVGDIPLVGDLDGDGKSEVIVWRWITSDWFWITSSSGYTRQGAVRWGGAGDVPLLGDFDGDGVDDIAVWRPSNGTWYWLLSSTGWTAGVAKTWGGLGDIPLVR